MAYTTTVQDITDTTAIIVFDMGEAAVSDTNILARVGQGSSTVFSQTVTLLAGEQSVSVLATGLAPNTMTSASGMVDSLPAFPETRFVTKEAGYTNPKTATQGQWEDLAARVNAKADATSIPTVNDSTITVTNNGTSKGTFTTNQASASSVALDYPVITMTTTDPGEGSVLAANNYIGVYGSDPIIMDYSSSEVNTGMKWVDGSAIYKKTVNFGVITANTPASVNHNISSLGIFVKSEAWGSSGNVQDGYFWYPIPLATPSSGISFTVTETEIGILSNFNLDQSYVTLYYTKSSS